MECESLATHASYGCDQRNFIDHYSSWSFDANWLWVKLGCDPAALSVFMAGIIFGGFLATRRMLPAFQKSE